MTKEKAIEVLRCRTNLGYGIVIENESTQVIDEVLDLAIKVLERQPSEDCVSRQAVLDLMQLKMGGRELYKAVYDLPPVTPTQSWIPVSERLPETDNENSINNYNVLLWVKNKSHPEREPQIYLGKLRQIDGDDGSGNFWRIETKPCDWTIWGWSYLNEPDVIAWQPLPQPYIESEE